MIKLLVFVIFAGLLQAQQTELINNTWYLKKMISGSGIETLAPNNAEVNNIQANFGETLMTTAVVNQFGAWTFPGPHIALTNTTIIYDEFAYSTNPCQIAQNCIFENNYFNVFKDGIFGIPIYYTITNENNYLKLILTNIDGNKIIYHSQNLSTSEATKDQFVVFPNPVKNILNISAKYSIVHIKLTDMQGKTILNKNIKKSINTDNFELDLNFLEKGVYLLEINHESTKKIIKQ